MHKPDRWTFHNLVGHTISEVLWLLGFEKFSGQVHDRTAPKHAQGTGRG